MISHLDVCRPSSVQCWTLLNRLTLLAKNALLQIAEAYEKDQVEYVYDVVV
uniref:Uncharacterized protein n=1 Tax=Anguilla anguilla TaxID=7936 RepID=A0A0E9Q5T3_ANGAN